MFPSKEDALQIALNEISRNIDIISVTDNKTDLNNLYGFQEGCWYIIYRNQQQPDGQICSSFYIAISKVDGRVVCYGALDDEG